MTRVGKYIVIGDLCVDVFMQVEAYPQSGGDGTVHQMHKFSGGSAANTAMALAKLGGIPLLLTHTGKDNWADQVIPTLADAGVLTSHIAQDADQQTGLTFLVVSNDAERTMFTYRGANRRLKPDEIREEMFLQTDFLHISSYACLTKSQSDAVLKAVQLARNIGVGRAGITRMAEGIVQPLGDMVLIIDTLALPRMFCVSSDTVIENDTSCLEYIHNPNFDFSQQVVLSQAVQFNPSSSGEVTIVEFEPDRIVAEVEAFGPTIVVINDNYTPGWKAYLNEQSIPVIRADYALRAVGIKQAGTYTLEMIYQPNSVKTGLIITIGAIVLWLIGIIISARKIL